MSTLLLVIIYIAFIGLGLPDSMFGTAWPAIYADFGLPISFGSFVTATVSCGTIISSLVSSRLIAKSGTGKVAAFSTLLTAAALIGFSFAPNIFFMVLLSVPLGIGAGAIDVALNNYVALHYSASQMSFLHCFYGIGVSVSPYVLSLVIAGENGWRNGYKITFIIQMCIAALLFLTLPLWKKVGHTSCDEAETPAKALSLREVLKIPGVKHMCALFFITCTIECTCSGWGSTFLVEYKKISAEKAAEVILLYFIGIAAGRFLSGIVASKLSSWTIIRIGMCVLAAAVIMLFIPGSLYLSAAAFFLIGLGNGPMFPNYNYMAPENFGKDVSQSVISIQMATAYVGIMIGPLICGLLGQTVGMIVFPFYIALFFTAMLIITVSAGRLFKCKPSTSAT